MMRKLSEIILKYKVVVVSLFLVTTIISLFLVKEVKINYNLADYLPKEAESSIAMKEITKHYSATIPNVKLMIPDVTIKDALAYKEKIKAVDGVKKVIWADDYFDLSNISLDKSVFKDWYQEDNALFLISIDSDSSFNTINQIKQVVPKEALMAGDAVNIAMSQENIKVEIKNIMLWVIPINLLILLLVTSSWFEPLLFMITIGIAIIINMGTNIIFGEISSITQSAVAILQLAVSMDYAIFLLHRFATLRHSGKSVEAAMQRSMQDSTPIIIASAVTTILGFLALVIMQFRIGPDLGIVLAKGIIFSLISVLCLLPVLTVYTYKIIDKTHHRSLIPSFKKWGVGIVKSRYVILIMVLLLVVPSFIASRHNNFLYGSTGINSEDSEVYQDTMIINKQFGLNNQMVLLIPLGDRNKELAFIEELKKLNQIVDINSFITTFGLDTPVEYLPPAMVREFLSDKYSRLIIKTTAAEEGKETFALVENIKKISDKYYDDTYHLAGISVTNYDMKQIITSDNLLVNIVAIISIIIVLIITFKSFFIPLVLILAIETAIWINLSIAYLMGSTLNYIGFIIVSAVQLGATVDYAILLAKKYLINREKMAAKQAAIATIIDVAPSILASATILGIAGFGLGLISTNGVISQLGVLVGRGALISAIMVLLFVPAMFMVGDKIIMNKVLKTAKNR
jgi:predicted RND superfamily exporter protein